MPDSNPGHGVTRNLGIMSAAYFSIATYFVYYVSVQVYKCQTNFESHKGQLFLVEEDSLADFYSSVCYLTSVLGHAALIAKVAATVRDLAEYPNYLYMYFLQHFSSFLFCGSISAIYYVRHRNLRQTVFRTLKCYLASNKFFRVDV